MLPKRSVKEGPILHPTNKRCPVTDILHGVPIEDPFRWLEDGGSPETQAWQQAQAQYTDAVLRTHPGRDDLKKRLATLRMIPDIGLPEGNGGTIIYQRREPSQNHSVLWAERGGQRFVVSDPNQLGDGDPMNIDWAHVSQDGRYVLYGLSRHGDEWAVLHVFDVEQQRLLDDRIPRARYTTIAFGANQNGFFYTRYPLPGTVPLGEEQYNSAVYYHTLGTSYESDPLVFQAPDDRRAIPELSLSESGHELAVNVSYGWSRSVVYRLNPQEPDEPARKVIDPGEETLRPLWEGDRLLALTHMGSDTGQVIEISLEDGQCRTVVPGQSDRTFVDAQVSRGNIFIHALNQGASEIMVFDGRSGSRMTALEIPGYGGLHGLSASGGSVYYRVEGFGMPPSIHRIAGDTLDSTVWDESAPPDPSVRVERHWAVSKDGTRIPVFVAMNQNVAQNGATPTVLAGYGGFDVAYLPAYSASVHDWLTRGGIYALALLRGGSEFGQSWHRSGMREHKQNVFDDFFAASQMLVDEGYTDAAHFAVSGRSNGGLLTGAFVTQHPDAARAAIIGVPLLDMVRFHRFLIADLWTDEYGSPDDSEAFSWIYAYSPYHHVRDNTRYPAVLLFTSAEDARVDPLHARKMTARLQDASSSGQPILFRLLNQAGHGVGKSTAQWVDEEADIWSFLGHQLGLSD